LETGYSSYVIEDVFVVVKPLVKNQCKGNKFFKFYLSFLFDFLDFLFVVFLGM